VLLADYPHPGSRLAGTYELALEHQSQPAAQPDGLFHR